MIKVIHVLCTQRLRVLGPMPFLLLCVHGGWVGGERGYNRDQTFNSVGKGMWLCGIILMYKAL